MAGEPHVYLYNFSRRAPDNAPAPNRAYHGSEIFYVFRNLHLFAQHWTDVDRRLENVVSTYWLNFAKSGDPNAPGLPEWRPYTRDRGDRLMALGDTVEERASPLGVPNIDLFDALYARVLAQHQPR